MAYRLGVDVGGTFTDCLLIDEAQGSAVTAKVPSTPADPSIGVLNGITLVCERAGTDASNISHVLHGTTVATNAVLTGSGARVGLVTTQGYRQVLQIARSFVPGALSGWVLYNKSEPLAPLECTVEVAERISASGEIVASLDETQARHALRSLKTRQIEALTISLINAYANGVHEQRLRALAEEELPGVPVSLSSEVIPEMQEYERTITTVANSYVRPVVETYVHNLKTELTQTMQDPKLHILRSDGGLASAQAAGQYPVNLLMSGPAGGVSGAIWVAGQAGYHNLLTFDMGGTSTDVALVQDGKAQLRRETTVGDVTVRASSVDVRSVGAGGGLDCPCPGTDCCPACRAAQRRRRPWPGVLCQRRPRANRDGCERCPGLSARNGSAGRTMVLDQVAAEQAVASVARGLDMSVKQAAAGIIDIVNEKMFSALRLISVQQGIDPRDYALIAFGGAGPLHANALAKLLGAWPVIIPRGPGVLCAYGDATTRLRNETSRTLLRPFSQLQPADVIAACDELAQAAALALDAEDVPRAEQTTSFEVDIRYHGQGTLLTLGLDRQELQSVGLRAVGERFDRLHTQLYTYALDSDRELVNLRAVVQGQATPVAAYRSEAGDGNPARAAIGEQAVFLGHIDQVAIIYDRAQLKADDVIPGPAIVTEMDSTSLILSDHSGRVDQYGNILIEPEME